MKTYHRQTHGHPALYNTTKFMVECGRIVGRMSAIEKKAEVVLTFLYITLVLTMAVNMTQIVHKNKYSMQMVCCSTGETC